MKKYSYVINLFDYRKKERKFRISYGYRYEKVVRDKTLVFFIEKNGWGYNATEETSGLCVLYDEFKTIKETKKYIEHIADAVYYGLWKYDHVKAEVQELSEWKKENNYVMVVQSGAQ